MIKHQLVILHEEELQSRRKIIKNAEFQSLCCEYAGRILPPNDQTCDLSQSVHVHGTRPLLLWQHTQISSFILQEVMPPHPRYVGGTSYKLTTTIPSLGYRNGSQSP